MEPRSSQLYPKEPATGWNLQTVESSTHSNTLSLMDADHVNTSEIYERLTFECDNNYTNESRIQGGLE
jgi:hypothetical protein